MTVAQRHHPIHLACKFRVVGRNQRRQTGFTHQCHQHAKHRFGGLRIKVAGGFIGKQHIRHIGQRTGNRHALLFAARQTRRTMITTFFKAKTAQQFQPAFFGLGPFPGSGPAPFAEADELAAPPPAVSTAA